MEEALVGWGAGWGRRSWESGWVVAGLVLVSQEVGQVLPDGFVEAAMIPVRPEELDGPARLAEKGAEIPGKLCPDEEIASQPCREHQAGRSGGRRDRTEDRKKPLMGGDTGEGDDDEH